MAMRKAVRNNSFTFEELKKVILDVDISLKGHPLSYTEDRKQLPILTQTQFCPASWMLYLRESTWLNARMHCGQDGCRNTFDFNESTTPT